MCRVLATEVGPSYAVVGCVPLCCGRQRESAARHAFRPTVLYPVRRLRRRPNGAESARKRLVPSRESYLLGCACFVLVSGRCMQKERLEKDKMVVARGDVSLAEKRVALRPQTIFASSRDRVAWTMRLESSGVQGHSGKLSTSTFQGYMGLGVHEQSHGNDGRCLNRSKNTRKRE